MVKVLDEGLKMVHEAVGTFFERDQQYSVQ